MLLYIFGIISNSKIFKSYGDQLVRYKINNKGMWLSKNIYIKKETFSDKGMQIYQKVMISYHNIYNINYLHFH